MAAETLIQPHERVLSAIAEKWSSGRELLSIDRLMAATGTAAETRRSYGPVPSEMRLSPPDLPETVKGVLARYVI